MMIKIAVILAILVLSVFAQLQNYSYDGTGNNLKNPNWGTTGLPLQRKCPAKYQDGIGLPATSSNNVPYPNPRAISNIIFGRVPAGLRPRNPRPVTDALTFWGQFISHDTSNSPDTLAACDRFFIDIPRGDPFFDPAGTGTQQMLFCRTRPITGTGTGPSNIREQPNQITSWIDGSVVYGSDPITARVLRTGTGGLMKTSPGPDGELLPINNDGNGTTLTSGIGGMANPARRVANTALFACGDARCNENPALASVHTLLVREHNRRVRAMPDSWDDERKYQTARRSVIAIIQHITFNEYIPALIGTNPPPYPGYNDSLNPQVFNEMSTAAFRYGHDEIAGILFRYGPDGLPDMYGNTIVRDNYFFPPAIINSTGIGAYLRGLAVNPQNAVDGMIDEDMRTFLFGLPPGTVPGSATDLAARNIQRGRDHGLCRYNDVRVAFGLTRCADYSCISKDQNIINALTAAYGAGNVDNVDLYVGGLLEDRDANTNLGPLFTVIMTEEFYRVRAADRFWYEREGVLLSDELSDVKSTTFASLILKNTNSKRIPSSSFVRSNIAPAIALGATGGGSRTPWIIAIVILAIIAGILLIVVIGLCFSKSSSGQQTARKDDQLYENLLESK